MTGARIAPTEELGTLTDKTLDTSGRGILRSGVGGRYAALSGCKYMELSVAIPPSLPWSQLPSVPRVVRNIAPPHTSYSVALPAFSRDSV